MFQSMLLIAIVVYFLWYRDKSGDTKNNSLKDPLDLARERYARGEISTEEFVEIKNNLLK